LGKEVHVKEKNTTQPLPTQRKENGCSALKYREKRQATKSYTILEDETLGHIKEAPKNE